VLSPMLEFIHRERSQYRALAVLSAGCLVLTGLLQYLDARIFQRVIGGINPLLAATIVVALGFVLLSWLLSRGGFSIYRSENRKGLLYGCGLATLFGVIVIPIDLLIRFPADINVPLPASLLFYPVVGFFAEILFHVLPLSLLLIVLFAVFRSVRQTGIVWLGIAAVAMIEPVYQTLWMVSLDRYPVWAVAVDALHVFAINLAQLIIFRRYDFVSMITLRWVYYLFWHIGWGSMRLDILF